MNPARGKPVAEQPGVVPFGDRALLVTELPPGIPELARALGRHYPGALVVAGLDSILVEFPLALGTSLEIPTPAELLDVLHGLAGEPAPRGGAEHCIEVRYDGADLIAVAAMLGCSAAEVASRHQRGLWTVAAVGFAPGFAYLNCDDDIWHEVPRRADPRRSVPAGSVAVAAGRCGVYPSATPGGWQLLGSTDAVLFDPGAQPPALLAVGDRVRFRESLQ